MDLKDLLFNKYYEELDGSIFESQSHFVERLTEEENIDDFGQFNKRKKSLYVIINSILNGHKKLKPKLGKSIRLVLKQRLENVSNYETEIDVIMQRFESSLIEEDSKTPVINAFNDSLKMFCKRSQMADNTLIVSESPIELMDSGLGFKFLEVISENIGLRGPSKRINYTYILPQDENEHNSVAAQLWSKLYHVNARSEDDEDLIKTLRDKNDEGQITVFSIPHSPTTFMNDVTCFDLGKISQDTYSPYSTVRDRIVMLKLNGPTLRNWVTNINSVMKPDNFIEEEKTLYDFKYSFEDAYNDVISKKALINPLKVENELFLI